jgi:uncharacterized protein YlxP (DUF503 family)
LENAEKIARVEIRTLTQIVGFIKQKRFELSVSEIAGKDEGENVVFGFNTFQNWF